MAQDTTAVIATCAQRHGELGWFVTPLLTAAILLGCGEANGDGDGDSATFTIDQHSKQTQFEGQVVQELGLIGNSDPSEAVGSGASSLQAWQKKFGHTQPQGPGCYDSRYPDTEMHKVPCRFRLPSLHGPARRPVYPRPEIVGDGHADAMVMVSSGTLNTVIGKFPIVGGLTSEHDIFHNNGFSVQVESSFFSHPLCNDGGPDCKAWQQWILQNEDGDALLDIQYWLVNYVNGCPPGWHPLGPHCYQFGPVRGLPSGYSIGVLSSLLFIAMPQVVSISDGSGQGFAAVAGSDPLDLVHNWKGAEFNVFGTGSGSQAIFNSGTVLGLRMELSPVKARLAGCSMGTKVQESNNLNIIPSSCCLTPPVITPSGTIVETWAQTFIETNGGSASIPFCLSSDIATLLYSAL